jgi:hypothetical protein
MRCWTNLNVAECEALEQPHVHMCSQRIRQRCEANVTGGSVGAAGLKRVVVRRDDVQEFAARVPKATQGG